MNVDFAAFRRKFDCIGQQVHQNLVDPQGIAFIIPVQRLMLVNLVSQLAGNSLRVNNGIDTADQFDEIEAFAGESHFSAFNTRHIENVVDQGKQVTGRYIDFRQAIGENLRLFHFELADRTHADNRVQGCTDIVAHAGQEIGFCLIGHSCRRKRVL